MLLSPDDLIKLLAAVVIGGLIGAEREFQDKAAGFRTMIFICTGAALYTILSAKLAPSSDPNRIAANIVSGVGFLGAGVILREGGRIIGITTAATIWLVAALGMGVGGGQYALTAAATVVILVILWIFPRIEDVIDRARERRVYEIQCSATGERFEQLEQLFQKHGLRVRSHRQVKHPDGMTLSWEVLGSERGHAAATKDLFADPDIREFRF